jgi:hypothetical protein
MIFDQHKGRLNDEKHQLRQAAERLLAGAPQRSNGRLTVSTLATEASLPRHRLYEHHAELVAEFKTAAGAGAIAPNADALQRQLADAHRREEQLKADKAALADRIRTLSAVITELSHEAHAENIVPMRVQARGLR